MAGSEAGKLGGGGGGAAEPLVLLLTGLFALGGLSSNWMGGEAAAGGVLRGPLHQSHSAHQDFLPKMLYSKTLLALSDVVLI